MNETNATRKAHDKEIAETLFELEQQRNALLEVLKTVEPFLSHTCTSTSNTHDCPRCVAIMAITKKTKSQAS